MDGTEMRTKWNARTQKIARNTGSTKQLLRFYLHPQRTRLPASLSPSSSLIQAHIPPLLPLDPAPPTDERCQDILPLLPLGPAPPTDERCQDILPLLPLDPAPPTEERCQDSHHDAERGQDSEAQVVVEQRGPVAQAQLDERLREVVGLASHLQLMSIWGER